MRVLLVVSVALLWPVLLSHTAQADGNHVLATVHGTDLGQGEGGGGPLFEDGTASGTFTISVSNGALIFSVRLESWFFEDPDHIVVCGRVSVIRNDLGVPLPPTACSTPIPISGQPVDSDLDGDGKVDHKEWVRMVD